MHYDSQRTNDKVRYITDYLSRYHIFCNEFLKFHSKNNQASDLSLMDKFYNSWRYYGFVQPLMFGYFMSPYSLNLFFTLRSLGSLYGKDKGKIFAGLLRNGLIIEICKLEDKVTDAWLNYAEFFNVIKPEVSILIKKILKILKSLTVNERHKVELILAEYVHKLSVYKKNSLEYKITTLSIIAKIMKYVNSKSEEACFREFLDCYFNMHQMNIEETIVSYLIKLRPVAVKMFLNESLLIDFIHDLQELKLNKHEFQELFKKISSDNKSCELDENNDGFKENKFFQRLSIFLKEAHSTMDSLNKVIKNESEQTKYFIQFLRLKFPDFRLVSILNEYNLTNSDVYDILLELTGEDGQKSISRYLNDPSKFNLFRIIAENNFFLKVLKIKLQF